MNKRLQHIRTLTIEELSGIISDEDKVLLYAAIEKDTEAKAEWEKTRAYFSSPEIQNLYNEIDIDESLQAVKTAKRATQDGDAPRAAKRKTMSRTALYTGMAAVIVIVMAIDYIVSLSVHSKANTNANMVTAATSKHIRLRLAGGQTIDLSSRLGNVQTGGQVLNNTGKALSFSGSTQSASALNSLEVPVGADYELHLQDGSIVWLNSETKIDFPFTFTGSTREISITGEAYLQVAHNPQKPFIVHLPGGTVKVLGTEFNVNTYDSLHTQVSLVEGRVAMKNGKDSVSILPGQEAVTGSNAAIRIQPFDADDVLSWRKGIHYFYNARIGDVNAFTQRWYGVSVKPDDEAITKELFSGSMNKNKPLTDFLENLKLSGNIDYYYEGNIVHLKQKQ